MGKTDLHPQQPDIQLSREEQRAREQQWRAMPADEQPHVVVFMGMLDYRVLSEHASKQDAEAELARWTELCDRANAERDAWRRMDWAEREDLIAQGQTMPAAVTVPSFTREACSGDFQLRTQASLDSLTDAIQRSYR